MLTTGVIRSLFTLDYEIHGNGDGCPHRLMVEPTQRMLDQFDRFGAQLTIMADVAEILKFKEHRDQTGRDDFHYEAIVRQLQDAVRRGHDVQLHLHCSFLNATFDGRKWVQDWSEYNFAGLEAARLTEVVRLGKEFLESLLRPVVPTYRCRAFRAANWAVSPSRNVVRALLANGIQIDTSVFKHGRRTGLVKFDYSQAPSEMLPWRVNEDDICQQNPSGALIEFPIYTERRWIGAFVTPHRVYRACLSRQHKVDGHPAQKTQNGASAKGGSIVRSLKMMTESHAWKADFNQCSGRQLVRALKRAASLHGDRAGDLPFVLIGHSKLFTRFNERSLQPFLQFVADHGPRFGFGTFGSFDLERIAA